MLDIKLIREQPQYIRQRLATRGTGEELKVDEVLALDERRRNLLTEVETLKAERNKISKQIGALMGQKKLEEAETMQAQTREMGEKIAALDKAVAEIEQARGR
jgi:seryl-tRNA synthetase